TATPFMLATAESRVPKSDWKTSGLSAHAACSTNVAARAHNERLIELPFGEHEARILAGAATAYQPWQAASARPCRSRPYGRIAGEPRVTYNTALVMPLCACSISSRQLPLPERGLSREPLHH